MTTDRLGMTVLTTHECFELLRTAEIGRLAVALSDQPEIFPVNYVVDHGTVVFRTAAGTKLTAVGLDGNVAFEVDGHDRARGEAWSVIIKGRAQELRGLHERFDASDLPLFPWQAAPKSHVVRIEPVEVSGRRFRVAAGAGEHRDPPVRRASPE